MGDSELVSVDNSSTGGTTSGTKRKKIKKTQPRLTSDEKRSLIQVVKKHKVIWDLKSEYHKDRNALAAAWKAVSTTTKISEARCRSNWKSLKQTNQRKKKPGNSGQGLEESDDGCDHGSDSEAIPDFDRDWEFSQDLNFVAGKANDEIRSTSTPLSIDEGEVNEIGGTDYDGDISSITSPQTPVPGRSVDLQSNYPRTEDKKKRATPEQLSSLSTTIEGYFKPAQEQPEVMLTQNQPELRYSCFYAYLDRVMQRLPESAAEDIQVELIKLVHSKVKELSNFVLYHVDQDPTA